MAFDQRKEQLLKAIVDIHIRSAEPVGSKAILDGHIQDRSGATIRNEMRTLEEEGYLTHPHTSAGRIPTEKGYQYYAEHLMRPIGLPQHDIDRITEILERSDSNSRVKDLAKYMAEKTQNAVIIAFGQHHMYYTGVSHLFSQPEFRGVARAVEMSQVFDHCEQRLPLLQTQVVGRDIHIFVGSDNPLGTACGLVAARVGESNLVMLLGPQRMEYEKSVSMLDHIQTLFA